MNLGTHYIALSVKDIVASKAFYEKLGFVQDERWGGVEQKWLMMLNSDLKIGLFQDMFPQNVLTFNPTDARAIYKEVKSQGLAIAQEGNMDKESGPCHFSLLDPDGNPVLIDQHND
ncbi:MAG: VOC family protein [Saprospiraceae bacterium]|nr:VOC family protein [Saprospiraceae bacterium]